jgi:hypothetical protein
MELFDLLKKIVKTFEKLDIPYLVTGSVASMAYGEPRLTNDIDIVAGIEDRHVAGLIEEFPADEFYISDSMIKEAISRHGQFNIIDPSSGLKIDVIIKKNTSFDNSRFRRKKRLLPSETYEADFAAPEDVIIKKMEYYHEGGSEKHLRDIAGILKISSESVDLNYVSDWANRLGLTDIWALIQARVAKKM